MAQSIKKIQNEILRWETAVREGRGQSVSREIKKLVAKKIPNIYRREIAALLRRIGDYSLALKVIYPKIYNVDNQFQENSSPTDVADYSLLLLRIGANNEALLKLMQLDPNKALQRNIYIAYCYFSVRNYEAALPYLLEYIELSGLSEYNRIIGRVNLLSALVETNRIQEAIDLSGELIAELNENVHRRLLANCYELRGQALKLNDDFDQAKDSLLESLRLLKQDSERYQYTALLNLSHLQAKKEGSEKPLLEFIDKAKKSKKFELLRQADYFRLEFINDQDLFCRLYYGTPYNAFKHKLLKAYPQYKSSLEKQWFFGKDGVLVNVKEGKFNSKQVLKVGSVCHQTFQALFYDLYRPRPLSVIHELISDGDPFIPVHTPNRIKQIVYRLNKELASEGVKIQVKIKKNYLIWESEEKLRFVFEEGMEILNINRSYLKLLKNQFGSEPFTRKEAQDTLQLSASQSKKVLKFLKEDEEVDHWNEGTLSLYQVS